MGHLRGVHIHYCPGVLGGDTCEGYKFITTRVFLEGTPAMGTSGFHYIPGVFEGDTYDGYIVHRFHELREIAPKKRTTRASPAITTTTTSVTNAQLKALIDKGVADALVACDADRSMNGDDSRNSGTGVRRNERVVRDNCSVENQIKFSTCTLLGSALTWWNSHVSTVGHDVAYAMTWADLKKKMTDKYCPMDEIKKLEVDVELESKRMFPKESDKIERYVGGLPDMIHRSVVASKPKTTQEAIEMATKLMDKKIRTFAEHQTLNKRKQDDNNNQAQQQPPKKQ
ncbi:hypothetical protein Tco_1382262, partial [Tanacetum coccineum]